MKIRFEIVDGMICRIISGSGIHCSTYYNVDEEIDLDEMLENIKNVKEYMLRYGDGSDVYL